MTAPEFFPPRLTAPPNILTCPGIWWHLNTINCHTDDKPIKKSFTPTKNLIRRSLPPGECNRWEVSRALLGVPKVQRSKHVSNTWKVKGSQNKCNEFDNIVRFANVACISLNSCSLSPIRFLMLYFCCKIIPNNTVLLFSRHTTALRVSLAALP